MKGYTSVEKIENFLLLDVEEYFEPQVEDWIGDVERFIDEQTGRNFIADSEASARLYNGDGTNELEIDDCVEVESVELGDDFYIDSGELFTETEDYITLPANAIAKGFPIKAIHLKNINFTKGLQNHRITAKWGYSVACPGDISMAATILTAHIYKFGRGGVVGGVSQERIGNYSVTYKDDKDRADYETAMNILSKYKRYFL